MPSRARVENNSPAWLRKVLLSPQIWHLNRRSVANGMAVGMFWAWIPMPAQSIPATLCSLWVRGNVPLTIAMCWMSNPLTMIPWIWCAYQIGKLVTGMEIQGDPIQQVKQMLSLTSDQGLWSGIKASWDYARSNVHLVVVFVVGSVIFAGLLSVATWLTVHGLWRVNLVRRWKRRGHPHRCPACRHRLPLAPWSTNVATAPHEPHADGVDCPQCGSAVPRYRRIGLGLASLARPSRGKAKA